MSKINVSKIVSLCDCKGNSAREQMTNMYRKIGSHILDNAERLSSDVGDYCNTVELKIKISPGEVVMLEKNNLEYIVEGK